MAVKQVLAFLFVQLACWRLHSLQECPCCLLCETRGERFPSALPLGLGQLQVVVYLLHQFSEFGRGTRSL